MAECLSPPVIETRDALVIVRDDLVAGGTKVRALPALLTAGAREYVYASPVYGYAQVSLAHAAAAAGVRATIFCAQRQTLHARTREAQAAGARIVQVPVGYMSVVTARAQAYCAVSGATLLPFGFDTPVFIDALAAVAADLPIKPTEVWSVAGSGVLTRALQRAWPRASFFAVRIGAHPNAGAAQVFQAPEQFQQDARTPPPFPSCSNYDAKAWRFLQVHAAPGALFWNVAA